MAVLICGGTHEEIDAWATEFGVTDYIGITDVSELPAHADGAMYLPSWPQTPENMAAVDACLNSPVDEPPPGA